MNEASRDRLLDLGSLFGILIGLAISIYLTVVHYQADLLVCGIAGDCHTVQSSSYATIGPIPVAILGVLLMTTLLGLWIIRRLRPDLAFIAIGVSFALLLAAVASEGYLTYVEIWVIDAICQWCVAFAIILLVLLVLTFCQLLFVVAPTDLDHVDD